jgi:L-lactate utilization protein LutC
MKKPTIKQIRQQAKEKINRMRAGCVRMTDHTAREAATALNRAENFYSVICDKDTRLQSMLQYQNAFLTEEKIFWDQITKGENHGKTKTNSKKN